jgi:CubicO group peptidase (beta-lactamase class C family)
MKLLKRNRRYGAIWWLLLCLPLWISAGCESDDEGEEAPDAAVADGGGDSGGEPYSFEWPESTPEEQGMDPELLEQARAYAFQEGKNTQGVVVIKNGVLVAEWYAEGEDRDSWATSWSMAKSFTSAAVGIAVDEGYIGNIDLSMAEFYPEWKGTDKEKITIRDVLHMASGLEWSESYVPIEGQRSDMIEMFFSADELAYAEGLGIRIEPGVAWAYSSGDTMLLSGVVEAATGMNLFTYAKERLFDPIGMDPVQWWEDGEGHTLGYCCIDTTTRNFAKFGYLFMKNGVWEGDQVVPAGWVAESTAPWEVAPFYGMQWWFKGGDPFLPDDMFAANGLDGQYIYIIPSLDLVVARNGYYDKSPGEPVAPEGIGYLLGENTLMTLNLAEYGTLAPDSWDEKAFLQPVFDSIQ